MKVMIIVNQGMLYIIAKRYVCALYRNKQRYKRANYAQVIISSFPSKRTKFTGLGKFVFLPHHFAGKVMTSYSSNWFTLLLLCTSAPLVLCCDRFDHGSRQEKCELVDLVMEDYDVSLC